MMPHDTSPTHSCPDPSGHRGSDHGNEPAFGSQWWEHHYQQSDLAPSGASPYVTVELADLPPGTALDAGCGTGADAIWLAHQGWDVTAVDISPTAITRARELAARQAPHAAPHIAWVVADLTTWKPPHGYDLVLTQYVHPGASFEQFLERLAAAVASAGTLLVVGHDHADSHSATHAPRNASIAADDITHILDSSQWKIEIAETRTRQIQHASGPVTLADTVIKAHRRRTLASRRATRPSFPEC